MGSGATCPFGSLIGTMRGPELRTQALPDLVIVFLIIKRFGRCWATRLPQAAGLRKTSLVNRA